MNVSHHSTASTLPSCFKKLLQRLVALFLTIWILVSCGFFFLLQVVLLPTVLVHRSFYYYLNAFFASGLWVPFQYIFEHCNDARIEFSLDSLSLPDGENAIVIVNHRSSFDFLLIHALAQRKSMLGYLKYFVKSSVKYIPLFGWVMYMGGFIFVKRNWFADKRKIDEAFKHYITLKKDARSRQNAQDSDTTDNTTESETEIVKGYPVWFVSFLEGSRARTDKILAGQEFCRQHEYPILHHLLFPRTKGFLASVQAFRNSHVKAVYDMTIAYDSLERGFGVAPSVFRPHLGTLCQTDRFHIHAKRYAIDTLPTDDEALTQWVRDRFYEKDAYLENVKQRWAKEKLEERAQCQAMPHGEQNDHETRNQSFEVIECKDKDI